MMKSLRTLLLVILISMSTYTAHSAVLTVSVDGMDNIAPDNIWTYQLNFDVLGDLEGISVKFNDTNQHLWEPVPGFSLVNWNHEGIINGSELVILADNKGTKEESPLVDGVLFTVEYGTNTDLNLTFFSFVSEDLMDINIPMIPNFDVDSNSLTFSPIPIPSSMLLLGGGLLTIFGIRRRQ